MPVPATNEELYSLIARSGVLEESRVKAYVDRIQSTGEYSSDPIKLGELMVRDGLLTNFQAEQLLQGRWKRFFIGKYKVLERLGVGGMGQVFLCEHKLMKRRVALKVLPVAKSKDEATLQRFYREARAVASVDHPNIARAYDIDEDGDLHFLVMEFVDGTNLHDLVKRSGPLTWLRAAHYIYGSAVGLQHAHEMGLVHRDVKPANILVDRSGVVKLLDMGLARFFNPDEDDHLTKKYDENVLGTADYLAPEQAIDSSSVDIRADIYGLGCTYYYLLTGQAPFPDGSVAQKLMWHQTKIPAAVTTFRSDVPPGLIAILEKMLAKKADQRFQNPAELMGTLAGWIQTPIGPPTEEELPKMSMAASGRVIGPAAMTAGSDLSMRAPAVAFAPAPATEPIYVQPYVAETVPADEPSPFDFSSFGASPPLRPTPVAEVPPPPPLPAKKPVATMPAPAPPPVKKPSAVVPVKPIAPAKAPEQPAPAHPPKPAVAIKPPPLLPGKAVAKPAVAATVARPKPGEVAAEESSPENVWQSLSSHEKLPVVKEVPRQQTTNTLKKPVVAQPVAPQQETASTTEEIVEPDSEDDFGGFSSQTASKSAGRKKTKPTPMKVKQEEESESPEPSATAARKKPKSNKALLIGLIVGGVLILGGAIAAVFVVFGNTKPSTTTPATDTANTNDTGSNRTIYLNATGKLVPDGATVVKSLAEIKTIKSGDTIYIMDNEFEFPQITLSKLKNIRIESKCDGGVAKWKYKFAKGSAVPPVISVQNCEGVTIRGFDIDVGGEADNAIAVFGTAVGVQFEKVTLRNCKTTGFRVASVVNDVSTPVNFTDCRVVGSGTLQQAMHFSNCGHVFVSNCRLEGNGTGQAILNDGTADLIVRNSRLFKFEFGLRVEPLPTDKKLDINVETSTFHSMSNAGVRVVGTPAESHRIVLASNYFVGCGEAASVPKDSKIVEQDNNGRQVATKTGNLIPAVPEVKVAPILGVSPDGPDDQFLKPKTRPNVNGRPVGYD